MKKIPTLFEREFENIRLELEQDDSKTNTKATITKELLVFK